MVIKLWPNTGADTIPAPEFIIPDEEAGKVSIAGQVRYRDSVYNFSTVSPTGVLNFHRVNNKPFELKEEWLR